ncbi:hypothetical protein GCM10011383_31540 [Hymenobacter cavernae]|uniref:Uncharacterized protein n=1 Tax=Hymenobacter cavernae TaxID=2044852 RepID=A0ABQ1UGY0_9BACT|nr:hypothetical protein GCM10011383_31540 [Hymenobacter cavernae]
MHKGVRLSLKPRLANDDRVFGLQSFSGYRKWSLGFGGEQAWGKCCQKQKKE